MIRLAQARREYWDAELPKRHPDYPVIHPGEDSGPPPPEEIQLREFLTSLPGDKVYELLLIMYLGRGDFGTRDLAARFDELKDTFDKPEQAVAQMMSKSPLADYLAEGLANLKKQKIDVDHLLPKPARPRK
ncbi:MAG TPA: DUF3775 domain-containing protein [Gemmataceae bacterium]